MRTPKKGDKCEHAWWDPERYTNVRDCPVRHMDGKPPGQLVARVKDKRTILVCPKHAVDFMAPNVRKQKKRAEVAEQVDAFQKEQAEIFKPVGEAYFKKALEIYDSMPEGI